MEPLTLDDLDARIADALGDRFDRVLTPGASDPIWLRAGDVARSLPPLRPSWIEDAKIGFTPPLVIFTPILAATVTLLIGLPTPAVGASALVGLAGSIALGVGLGPRMRRARARAHRHYFRPELVDALIPTLAPTAVEEAYLRALVALMGAQSVLGPELSHEILAAQNQALAEGRRREQSGEADNAALDALRATRDTLAKLRQTPEPAADTSALDAGAHALRGRVRAIDDALVELRAVTGSGSGR